MLAINKTYFPSIKFQYWSRNAKAIKVKFCNSLNVSRSHHRLKSGYIKNPELKVPWKRSTLSNWVWVMLFFIFCPCWTPFGVLWKLRLLFILVFHTRLLTLHHFVMLENYSPKLLRWKNPKDFVNITSPIGDEGFTPWNNVY